MVAANIRVKKLVMQLAAAVVFSLAVPGIAPAEPPAIGDVQKLKVITFSLQVGNMEKETKRVTYTPPPGWFVRSHWVECTEKQGNTSFSVSTVPQNWCWLSEERVDQSYKMFLDLAAQAQNIGLQAKLKQERS